MCVSCVCVFIIMNVTDVCHCVHYVHVCECCVFVCVCMVSWKGIGVWHSLLNTLFGLVCTTPQV